MVGLFELCRPNDSVYYYVRPTCRRFRIAFRWQNFWRTCQTPQYTFASVWNKPRNSPSVDYLRNTS